MKFLTNDKLVIVGAAGMIGSNMAQTALMMGLTSNLCLYDVFSPEGVADAIERIADPETLARFRANMERERERFSWKEMCRRLLEVYALTAKRAV